MFVNDTDALVRGSPCHYTRVHLVQPITANAIDIDGIIVILVNDDAVAHQLPLRFHDRDRLGGGDAVVGHIQIARSWRGNRMEKALVIEVSHLRVTGERASLQVARLQDAILVVAPNIKGCRCRNRQIVAPWVKVDDTDFVILGSDRHQQTAITHGTHRSIAGMIQDLVVSQDA